MSASKSGERFSMNIDSAAVSNQTAKATGVAAGGQVAGSLPVTEDNLVAILEEQEENYRLSKKSLKDKDKYADPELEAAPKTTGRRSLEQLTNELVSMMEILGVFWAKSSREGRKEMHDIAIDFEKSKADRMRSQAQMTAGATFANSSGSLIGAVKYERHAATKKLIEKIKTGDVKIGKWDPSRLLIPKKPLGDIPKMTAILKRNSQVVGGASGYMQQTINMGKDFLGYSIRDDGSFSDAFESAKRSEDHMLNTSLRIISNAVSVARNSVQSHRQAISAILNI